MKPPPSEPLSRNCYRHSLMMADWVWLAAGLLGGGAAAGLLAGLLGVGGGVVMVPILFQLMLALDVAAAVQMHVAVGTSLAIIVVTGSRAAQAQIRRRALDWAAWRMLAWPMALGTALGAWAVRYVSADGLKLIFALALCLVAAKLLLAPDWGTAARQPLARTAQRALAAITGFLSAWLGIGGGIFSVLLLRAAGHAIHRAVATSSGLGVVIALAGAAGFVWSGWGTAGLPRYALGYVYLPGLAMALASLVTAPWGVRLSHAFQPRQLELVFAGFLLLAAARMLYALT